MEIVPIDSEDGVLAELLTVRTTECLNRLLDSQRDIFFWQVDQLEKIVVCQCKITGVNPLSQEMAAGALSVNIGKKPRDLLNLKAIRYMQSIFAMKDVISKKETREISVLCGITVTQVREFFASQKSRIRTLVRLSREKAINSNGSNETGIDRPLLASDPTPSAEEQISQEEQVTIHADQLNHVFTEPADVRTIKDETLPPIEADDDKFLEQIFGVMKKENTFSGQMKLVEWILQIQTTAVLLRFLTKGGLSILATWLAEAVIEEQTTVILAIFKVLCHLPLHKALPGEISGILQTVNKLRFYRTSDVSNKARVLLSRWSKILIRSQGLKRPASVKYASEDQKEMIRRQRICEILSDGSWDSKIDLPEDILALSNEDSDHSRKLDSKKAIKMLPAACNESTKKTALAVSCPKTKEKRKVLLVEHTDSRNTGRSVAVARAVQAKGSRPMSSDDIQKAKMQAVFMQRKYSNTDATINPKSSSNLSEKGDEKPILENLTSTSEFNETSPMASVRLTNSLASVRSKSSLAAVRSTIASASANPALTNSVPSGFYWRMPPVIRMNELWSVGGGENSKEMDVQKARTRREQEVFYTGAVPLNPKEPWDVEMDFDDSLTPQIPTEPPPDADVENTLEAGEVVPVSTPLSIDASAADGAPDLELLAVLLKNPQLVFALTSGEACGLSNAETIALLDVLKHASSGADVAAAAAAAPPSQAVATSLPSPTPASESSRKTSWETEQQPPPALLRQAPPSRKTEPTPPALVRQAALPHEKEPPSPALLRQVPPPREAVSHSPHPHHHHHGHLVRPTPPTAALAKAEMAGPPPPLLPTPPRAHSPLLGWRPNGLLELPNERVPPIFVSRPLRPPLGYHERAPVLESWSPDHGLWPGPLLPPPPTGRWIDRNPRF